MLRSLGIEKKNCGCAIGNRWLSGAENDLVQTISPVDGKKLPAVSRANEEMYEQVIGGAQRSFSEWRDWPAPKRGQVVRKIGIAFREKKEQLARLISIEVGKPISESLGEIQEMIDICDFAVGLSRQLYGLTMSSERSEHRLYEQYHPLGVVGVITAFNFPGAVWAWNAMIAAVCGNSVVWKPAPNASLTAIATHKIVSEVLSEQKVPDGVFALLASEGSELGAKMSEDKRISLISFTGSTATGKEVGAKVASRFGKSILELGGNNASIVTAEADLGLALPAALFAAVGTAGQRCTTLRRLIVHANQYDALKMGLATAYQSLRIGSPLESENHMGPLIDRAAVQKMQVVLERVREQGGKLVCGGELLEGEKYRSGCYVTPAVVEVENDYPIVQQETFAPILYLIRYEGSVENAIQLQNSSRHGLSSSIFTKNLREAEIFLAAAGSDCGIANVNVGTSGAEIGGAFGGEKESGGGRESGSDAWKGYMRRQTVTINYGDTLPLSQGVVFEM